MSLLLRLTPKKWEKFKNHRIRPLCRYKFWRVISKHLVIVFYFVELDEKSHGREFLIYWISLCVIMIWFPLVIMITSFGFIYYKLKKSLKAFPYLSHQSKVARSRKKVIHMLLMLIIIEIICWSPWQSWIIFQFHLWNNYNETPEDIPDVINF